MAKRTNRVACLLAMACLWFPALGAEQARGPFADIPMNAPAAAAVNSLAELGLVNGYPDGLYRGKKQMSRYEGMTVVYRLLQQRLMRDPALPVDVGMPILAPAMSDVPADHWAAD